MCEGNKYLSIQMYSSVRMRILLSLEVLLEKCLTVVTEVTSLRIENSGIFLTELIMLLKHQGVVTLLFILRGSIILFF